MSANCGDTTRGSGGRDHLPLTPLVPFSLPSCLVFPLLLPFFFLLFSSRTFFLFPFPLILCLLTFIIPLLLLLFLLYAPPVTTFSSLLLLSDLLFPLTFWLSCLLFLPVSHPLWSSLFTSPLLAVCLSFLPLLVSFHVSSLSSQPPSLISSPPTTLPLLSSPHLTPPVLFYLIQFSHSSPLFLKRIKSTDAFADIKALWSRSTEQRSIRKNHHRG